MSDIGILNDPASLALLALIIGAPGLALGSLFGALTWRAHRFAGAGLGALFRFVLWLTVWLLWNDVI
jgi:hypothetical protein